MLALITLLAPLQTAGVSLAADSEARWVAFELTPSNQIRFVATLDGRPVRAILDTGVTHTIVTGALARSAGLDPLRQDRALTPGGDVAIAWAEAGKIAFGGLVRNSGRVGIADAPILDALGAQMIVGSDVLACCALEIDYDARRFRMLASGRLPFTGATAPLRRRGASPYTSEAVLAGKRLRPLLVDTGDGAMLTLTRAAWLTAGYAGPVTTTLGWGVGGPSVTGTAVLPSLSLAGGPPAEAEVRAEGRGGFSERAGFAGRIGNGLLLRYRVLLDPRAGRMVLDPGAAAAAPVPRSTSGLLVRREGAALHIVHVMRNSPADTGGWKADERICRADGQPIGTPGSTSWLAGTPGRSVRLTLCDGRTRTLVLRDFY